MGGGSMGGGSLGGGAWGVGAWGVGAWGVGAWGVGAWGGGGSMGGGSMGGGSLGGGSMGGGSMGGGAWRVEHVGLGWEHWCWGCAGGMVHELSLSSSVSPLGRKNVHGALANVHEWSPSLLSPLSNR